MAMLPPERLTMGSLLGNRVPFRIPVYQRGYAWQSDEWRDFVEDIRVLLEANDSMHFFGEILSVKLPMPESRTGQVFELVDGQQRTTTFTLLIHAIVEGMSAVASEAQRVGDETTAQLATREQEQRRREFVTYEEYEPAPSTGVYWKNRLQLSRRDDDFFRALLSGNAPRLSTRAPHSHRSLMRAFEWVRQQLVDPIVDADDLSPAEKLSQLQKLLKALTERCVIVHITTDNSDEAYNLFTVLNDRGRSLTDGDLIRTRTLELLARYPEQQREAEAAWDSILRGRPNEVREALRGIFASHTGYRWPSQKLHKELWKEFFAGIPAPDSVGAAQEVVQRIRELAEEAEIYRVIREGEWPYEDGNVSAWFRRRLSRLMNVLRGAASAPLLLSLARTRDEQFFAEAVSFLERFTFRYNVVGGHASALGDCYYAEAKKIRDNLNEYSLATLKAALGQQLLRYRSEELFKTSLADRLKYSRANSKLLAHFLTTLEDYSAWISRGAVGDPQPDSLADFDLDAIHIEHIYPQRPRVRVPDLEALTHDLGNLTFWSPSDNITVSNAPFAEKKSRYAESRVAMNRELSSLSDWDATTLANRRDALIDAALKVFAVAVPEPDRPEDELGGVLIWMVQQNPESRYRDREGEVYDYPDSIANAQQVMPGDIVICYRAQRAGEGDRRIFGVGRIGDIHPDGDRLLALYDHYISLSPMLSFEEIGGDPRANRRNSINQVKRATLARVLDATPLLAIDEAPGVNPDISELLQIGLDEEEAGGVD